jgi:hypothetical protein
MCLMVPACPIYPSTYTKKARRGGGEETSWVFPSPSLPLHPRPYSSAASRWNNGTMDDLRAYAHVQAHRQRQRRVWGTYKYPAHYCNVGSQFRLVRLSRTIIIIILHQNKADSRTKPKRSSPFLNVPKEGRASENESRRDETRRDIDATGTLVWGPRPMIA